MNEQGHQRVDPSWGATQENAPAVLAQLRQQVMRYADVPINPGDADPGTREPVAPLSLHDLPAEMQQLAIRYQKVHRTELQPVMLLSVGGPGDVGLPFDDTDLPDDFELVLLVRTETAASSRSVEVRSQVLVARSQAL